LQSLMDAAKQQPRPFDILLVDDTSRLARNTEDSLRSVAIFQFNGLAVISVSQGIDSRQKSSRQLLTLHAMIDEQYIVGADKVHRGQEGQVLEGLVAGGGQSEGHQSELAKLRAERDLHRGKAQRLADAIADQGHSAALLTTLAKAESKMAELDMRIESQRPPDIKASTYEIRDYALKSILDLKSLLRSVTQKAKMKLAQHVKELVLTPGKRDGEDVYEVDGEWELLPEKKCVITMVARDGFGRDYMRPTLHLELALRK
jgi:hypothetical protein